MRVSKTLQKENVKIDGCFQPLVCAIYFAKTSHHHIEYFEYAKR